MMRDALCSVLLSAMAGSFAPEVVRVEGIAPQRVQLSVSVLDKAGEPVTGLDRADFLVEEDGLPQAILDFGRESERQDRPLSVVFLVDRSGSIGKQMGKWGEACAALASALRPIDEVRLATFASDLKVLQDFTSDPNLLAAAVGDLGPAGGGTDIYRSIEQTLHDLRDRPGRKVIFLLTDGLDNLRADVWSVENDPYLSGLVRQAVAFQTTIVTILPGPTGRPYLAAQDLAVQTGGWWHYPTDDLPRMVRRLGVRLLESYYIAYDSPRKPGDERKRRIEVQVVRPGLAGLQVRTAAGAFGDAPLLEALRGDLADGDEDERVRAAMALASLNDRRGAAALMKALKDDSPRVRAAAIDSLTTIAGRSADQEWQAKILEAIEAAERRARRRN